jgi:hypothetical protein
MPLYHLLKTHKDICGWRRELEPERERYKTQTSPPRGPFLVDVDFDSASYPALLYSVKPPSNNELIEVTIKMFIPIHIIDTGMRAVANTIDTQSVRVPASVVGTSEGVVEANLDLNSDLDAAGVKPAGRAIVALVFVLGTFLLSSILPPPSLTRTSLLQC